MTPKSLLRHPDVRSSFDDFIGKSCFKRIIPETGPALEDPINVKRILFCSGKVYYEVAEERGKIGKADKKILSSIAMTRLEQVHSNIIATLSTLVMYYTVMYSISQCKFT